MQKAIDAGAWGYAFTCRRAPELKRQAEEHLAQVKRACANAPA